MRFEPKTAHAVRVWTLIVLGACDGGPSTPAEGARGDAASKPVASEPLEAIVEACDTNVAPMPLEQAGAIALPITRDTSIRASCDDANFGREDSLDISRALLGLDDAALASAIGPDQYLVSATLKMSLVPRDHRRHESPRQLSLHRLQTAWTEQGATWKCAVDSRPTNQRTDCNGATAWKMTGPSVPFAATATSVAHIPALEVGVVSFDVTADIRSFFEGSAANHGWIVKRSNGSGELAEIVSREGGVTPTVFLTIRQCSASACDDGNVCTSDSCSLVGECVHAPAVNGSTCDDGNSCTSGDACGQGVCQPGALAAEGASCGVAQACTSTGECVATGVVINEVESSGGSPGDFVELFNPGANAVDVSHWIVKDNDDSHAYPIPSGTTMAAGSYLILEEAALGYGLGGADSVRLFDASATILLDSYAWTSHAAATTYGRCPNGSGDFSTTALVTKGAANQCDDDGDGGTGDEDADLVINEIESSGGTPGDWIEIYNRGGSADISGYRLKDNDDTHAFYVIPSGTTLAAGAFLVIEEAALGFGLGGADNARLFNGTSSTPIDSYSWSTHATTAYGRCPDGTGAFTTTTVSTKGAANNCGAPTPGGLSFAPWPATGLVNEVDVAATFGGNLSDVAYEPAHADVPATLWTVQNSPSVLFRLATDGSTWSPVSQNDWEVGKQLRYPGGYGNPDAEGVTSAEVGSEIVYVASERDNDVSATSRISVLRFDTATPGNTLVATHEWNLTSSLPVSGANAGIEAIAFVPDALLTSQGLRDERLAQPYDPSHYADHGGGLFFVGLESSGSIYAYALDHASGEAHRVATFASGLLGVMALHFDAEANALWAHCDEACGNRTTVLSIDGLAGTTLGQFIVRAAYEPPAAIASLANEGFALSSCNSGQRTAFWTDDSETNGHSLRSSQLSCGIPVLP